MNPAFGRSGAVGWDTALQAGSPLVTLYTGIFRTVALGSTQPLTEMSTSNISWRAKVAGLQPYRLHVPTVLKCGSLNLLEPSGPVQACNGIALPLRVVSYWSLSASHDLFLVCGC
jgi:hypothetical protein